MISSFCSGGDCVIIEMVTAPVCGATYGVIVSSTATRESVAFTPDEWRAFLRGVKAGEFDLE